ncbi:hypothetical protein [Tahibacter soli]|uniref:Uncharacterized protein n=1 Tax=Tahibacter soli TaxID=2983605 RepID=A0A9X4BHS1_9GAMM|nr:hypothetical protein [Tahibacter soli]MDC8012733.1 hypothetical protein [Tahibacter soli]
MTRSFVRCCLVIVLTLFAAGASAKKEVVRQLGGACGEDADIIARCDVGLECKNGNCAMRSFLSSATVGCKGEMAKVGVGSKELVAVHDGFCYMDGKCGGLYNAVMDATPVTERLLAKASAGSEAFGAELASLSDADKAKFKRAEDICNSCAPYCVIGSGFLGRGGY